MSIRAKQQWAQGTGLELFLVEDLEEVCSIMSICVKCCVVQELQHLETSYLRCLTLVDTDP